MPNEVTADKIGFARQLRREQTPYEIALWAIIKAHKMKGWHFRRQHPVGPYFADFACPKAKLVIELDGVSHDQRMDYDAKRDADLATMGWKVLRFPNVYARDNPSGLWQMIEMELSERTSAEVETAIF